MCSCQICKIKASQYLSAHQCPHWLKISNSTLLFHFTCKEHCRQPRRSCLQKGRWRRPTRSQCVHICAVVDVKIKHLVEIMFTFGKAILLALPRPQVLRPGQWAINYVLSCLNKSASVGYVDIAEKFMWWGGYQYLRPAVVWGVEHKDINRPLVSVVVPSAVTT